MALALGLRLVWLGMKPAHFDEGVNGYFVDEMSKNGFYHYDPTNFHGPFHFYILFVAQTLFGRHEWVLRLPISLISAGCVAMLLAFRSYFGRAVCQLAALGMAVSPAFVFYGRYAIHESEFVFFMILMVWGLCGLCRFGEKRHLWAAGAGFAGLILTKETWIIHAVSFAAGYAVLLWLEPYLPSAPFARARPRWSPRDLRIVAGVCALAIFFFYTGGFLDWPGPRQHDANGHPLPRGSLFGLIETFAAWTSTGTHGAGHEKPPWYWLDLLRRYEWPAGLGLIAAIPSSFVRVNRHLRWLAISAWGALVAYSIVLYKTPWCLVSIIWPFYFTLGAALTAIWSRFNRAAAGVAAAVAFTASLCMALQLNFKDFTDEREPYVYVQTTLDINKLLDPLRTLVAQDATNYHLPGFVVLADVHPLPWLLKDYTRIQLLNLTELPDDVSEARLFLVAAEYQEEIERTLRGRWFRESIVMRGNSGATQWLYLRADKFGPLFPGRVPEFDADTAPRADDAEPTDDAAPDPAEMEAAPE